MPTPAKNAWFRHHQQSRTSTFRLVHFQILGGILLGLGVVTLMARMHPYQGRESTDRAQPQHRWSHINGDQLLSLFGMGLDAPPFSGDGSHIIMHQRTNVSVKMLTHESGGNKERTASSLTKQEDPPGIVPHLNATVDMPLGPEDQDQSPLCTAFGNARTVAIVGNGPLDQAQRAQIDACEAVVRFNLMNNWRRFKEKVDVWVIRYSTEATLGYWGITNMLPSEATKVLGLMKAVWLVGGRQRDADGLLKKVPATASAHPVLVPQEALSIAYSRQMNVTSGYPSTGFVGLLGALHCTPDDTVLHLFGFNWHNSTWKGHKMELEKAFVEGLAQEGRVVVHETTCYGIRECGGSSTFDASCHWNSSGRYVCLRGKPRKWMDLTDTLGTGRLEQFRGQAPKQTSVKSGN